MTIYQLLDTQLNMPIAYGYHSQKQDLPYLVIIGAGQEAFQADATYYVTKDNWQIELYFKTKDPSNEKAIEELLLNNGYRYDKSEDVYIESEDVFVIYYDI